MKRDFAIATILCLAASVPQAFAMPDKNDLYREQDDTVTVAIGCTKDGHYVEGTVHAVPSSSDMVRLGKEVPTGLIEESVMNTWDRITSSLIPYALTNSEPLDSGRPLLHKEIKTFVTEALLKKDEIEKKQKEEIGHQTHRSSLKFGDPPLYKWKEAKSFSLSWDPMFFSPRLSVTSFYNHPDGKARPVEVLDGSVIPLKDFHKDSPTYASIKYALNKEPDDLAKSMDAAWKRSLADRFLILADAKKYTGTEKLGNLPEKALLALRREMMAIERLRLQKSLREFTSHMDRDALRLMARTGMIMPSAYAWLLAGGDEAKSANRRRAVQNYPILAYNFVQNEDLTRIIDEAQPLAPVLRARFVAEKEVPLKPYTLKRIAGMNRRIYGARVSETLTYLDALPPEWWPEKKEEWESFKAVTEPVSAFASATSLKIADIIQEPQGRWAAYDALCKKFNNNQGFTDFLMAINKALVAPLVCQQMAAAGKPADYNLMVLNYSKKFFEIIWNSQSMAKMMKKNRDWHDRIRTFNARIKTIGAADGQLEGQKLEWPALSEKTTAPNGLTIEALTTQGVLEEEGDKMDHCVSGYASMCLLQSYHVMSIRDADGKRLSTLGLQETAKDDGKRAVFSDQHTRSGNFSPKPEAEEAAQWYMDQIETGAITPDWQKIDEHRKTQKEIFANNNIRALIGFDPYNAASCARAFEVCKPYLPKEQRAMLYEEWLEKTGIRAAVQNFDPEESEDTPMMPLQNYEAIAGFIGRHMIAAMPVLPRMAPHLQERIAGPDSLSQAHPTESPERGKILFSSFFSTFSISLKIRIASPVRGIVRLWPFLVTGIKAVLASKSISGQRRLRSSPRLIAVSIANRTRGMCTGPIPRHQTFYGRND